MIELEKGNNVKAQKLWILLLLMMAVIGILVSCDRGMPAETGTQDATLEDATTTNEPTDGFDTSETDDENGTGPVVEDDEGSSVTDTDRPMDPDVQQPGELICVANEELRYLDNLGEMVGCAYEPGRYDSWTKRELTVGKTQVAMLVDWGWAAFNSTAYTFGYVINGEQFFSDVYAAETEESVKEMATQNGATNCSRYYGVLTTNALRLGKNTVQFCVRLDGDVLCVLREYAVTVTEKPVKLDGTYWSVDIDTWTVSGHNPHIQDSSNGMVAAGGVDKGALLHQGAVGIGTVDLSKYKKVVVYFGCDNSATTQDRYANNSHNRIILSKTDSNGKMSPDEKDIIASVTYSLSGWSPVGVEIDLTNVNYNGPVYVTMDFLPGTFALVTAIEFIGGGKTESTKPQDPPAPPATGNYVPSMDNWTVSGHNPHIQDTSNGMVAAAGVEKAALLHQGAIGVGTVDLSKYSKVIIMWGCDNSQTTIDRYNANAHNRIMLTKVDTDGQMSPDSEDIIAYANYTLGGWRVQAIEIDLSKVTYKGPVYITIDALPGTFALFSSIEFVAE